MKNIDVMKHFYSAFQRGDSASALACIADDVSWSAAESNPLRSGAGPVQGKEAVILNVFAKLDGVFEGLRAEVAHLWDAGDVVVAEGRYKARYRVTGAPVDHQFCHVWRLRNGLIVNFQQYTDTAQLQAMVSHRGHETVSLGRSQKAL